MLKFVAINVSESFVNYRMLEMDNFGNDDIPIQEMI